MNYERCELIEKARKLAQQRKLDSSQVDCAFTGICTGARCVMLDQRTRDIQLEKFITKPRKEVKENVSTV